MGSKVVKSTQTKSKITPALEEGDYYLDPKGLMVFTRQYHLKRGFCCKSGCIHCPYGFKKLK